MRIEKIHIKGFRNFEDEEIFFQPKTLIIGANDVGKTNLLYALRILFDKSISEHDLDLKDSDYNAYCNTDTVEITATICDVTEECLLSTFGGAVKDGVVLIRYSNSKNGQYSIWMGYDENVLTEYSTRQYIKRLNMQYVDTNRDLFKFLKHERLQILHISKELLKEEQKLADEENTKEIQNKLNEINNQISSLNYVASALENVNIELSELSVDNEDQKIRFIAGESDAGKLLDNLTLSFSTGDNLLSIGGDGRNNQIFLATWIAKQNIQKNVDHVGFKPYIAVCNALNISWVMRTDNDVFAKPNKKPTKNYYAGISRVMGILTQFKDEDNELIKYWNEHDNENEWEYKKKPPKEAIDLNTYIREEITQYGIYLSMFDLETDLAKSSIKNILKEYYGKKRENSLIKAMQTHKAKNMMDFLSEKRSELGVLREDDISKPLIALRSSVEERIHPKHD